MSVPGLAAAQAAYDLQMPPDPYELEQDDRYIAAAQDMQAIADDIEQALIVACENHDLCGYPTIKHEVDSDFRQIVRVNLPFDLVIDNPAWPVSDLAALLRAIADAVEKRGGK